MMNLFQVMYTDLMSLEIVYHHGQFQNLKKLPGSRDPIFKNWLHGLGR